MQLRKAATSGIYFNSFRWGTQGKFLEPLLRCGHSQKYYFESGGICFKSPKYDVDKIVLVSMTFG